MVAGTLFSWDLSRRHLVCTLSHHVVIQPSQSIGHSGGTLLSTTCTNGKQNKDNQKELIIKFFFRFSPLHARTRMDFFASLLFPLPPPPPPLSSSPPQCNLFSLLAGNGLYQ